MDFREMTLSAVFHRYLTTATDENMIIITKVNIVDLKLIIINCKLSIFLL